MKNKVTKRDLGARALLRTLATSAEVTVGVHASDGAQPKDGDDGGDMSLIDVAIIHEFGAPEAGIPARSFIREWADENADQHKAALRRAGKAIINGVASGGAGGGVRAVAGPEQELGRVGARFVGEVQRRISAGIEPELKQRTIDRKGSSTPLIDTGQLRSSVAHEVKVTK